MAIYLLAACVFFLGGLVQGCMGFGFAMVVAPPLLMVMPATTVVPSLVVASLLNTSTVAWHLRRHVERGMVGRLLGGAVFGLPVGIYLLKTLEGPVFKAGVGAFMIVLAFVLLRGGFRPLREPRAALYPVGFASGFLNGSISISGPPVILFLSSQGLAREVFRGTIVTYFALSGVLALTGFIVSGVLTWEAAGFAAGMIPAVMLGTWIGIRLATGIPQRLFQRLTLLTVAGMGLVLMLRNVAEFI